MPNDPPHLFPVSPIRVLEVVAEAYNLTPDQLIQTGKIRLRAEARGVACALLHDESRLSWTAVAALMDRRSTWVSVVAKQADPSAVDRLRARLHLNGNQGSLW